MPEAKKAKVKEFATYVFHTWDSIDPITNRRFGQHDEHLVVMSIKRNGKVLVRNLETGMEHMLSEAWFELGMMTGHVEEAQDAAPQD